MNLQDLAHEDLLVFPLYIMDSFASKTKIIPLNRKHSQLYHSHGLPCLAQLLMDVLLR